MKYKNTTIVEIARKRGSRAKTRKGAWSYLLSRFPSPKKIEWKGSQALPISRGRVEKEKYLLGLRDFKAEKICVGLGLQTRTQNEAIHLQQYELTKKQKREIRRRAGAVGRAYPIVVNSSDCPPKLDGSGYVKYHWHNCGASGTVYHPSTHRVSVGVDYLPIINKACGY